MSALINNSFDELVFENRNKTFGAFKLRQVYDKYITGSMFASVMLFSLGISSPVIYNKYFRTKEVVEKVQMVEVKLEDIAPIMPDNPLPPPPPPPRIEMPKLSTVKFLPPEVKPDEQVSEEIPPTVEELQASNPGSVDQEGELTVGYVEETVYAEVIEEEKEEVFTWVAEMPEFKGGDEALIKFLSSRLTYPKDAAKNLIEGDVWLEFIVNKDGSLTDFKVLRSLGHGCDEEALKVARQMPAWKPAYQNGKAVKLKKKLKITFRFPG